MVMFKEGQLVQVDDYGLLNGKSGQVMLVESDGSAWIKMRGGEELTAQVASEYRVRGACILLWPEFCRPL